MFRYSFLFLLASVAWADCTTATATSVSIRNGTGIVSIMPATSGINVHVCTISIGLDAVVTTQLQQTNGGTNTPTGTVWNNAGPNANLNGSTVSGLGNGLSISISAFQNGPSSASGGGMITYYTTTN